MHAGLTAVAAYSADADLHFDIIKSLFCSCSIKLHACISNQQKPFSIAGVKLYAECGKLQTQWYLKPWTYVQTDADRSQLPSSGMWLNQIVS